MATTPQFDPTKKFATVRGEPGVGYLQGGNWFTPQRTFIKSNGAAKEVPAAVAVPPPPPLEEPVAAVEVPAPPPATPMELLENDLAAARAIVGKLPSEENIERVEELEVKLSAMTE